MKIWYLVLFYDNDKLESITPHFCLPFEKELLEAIKNIYNNIDIRSVSKIISFTKNLSEIKIGNKSLIYGDSNSFLYKIQAGFFNYTFIEDKDKKDYFTQINEEIKWYNKLISPFEKFWSNELSIKSLKSQYIYLKKDVERNHQAEKYKNCINELIATVNNYHFEDNEKYKEKLIHLLQSKLNNPTKEVYENCKVNIDNYLKNLKVKLPGNKIIFPFNESNNLNDFNNKDIHVICLDILKTYSLQHKKLSEIFKKTKNILSDIFQLDKEIEIITDILGKYALEKGEFIHMYKKKVMGIIRALILYKIINIGKKKEKIEDLFCKFIKVAEVINDQIGGRGNKFYNDDILKWTKTATTNLEDYLIIPKFEPKDFLYLFLITYTEENENKNISIIPSKGFLFKNSLNKEIESVLYQALHMYEQQEINDSEKNLFQNYIEKIGRSLFKIISPDKCDENFDKLSYMELTKILELEKESIKKNILELKKKNQSYEIEEIHYDIIKQILNCFTLATAYEQNYSESNIKLTYEDIDFFNNKSWNNKLMSMYPGMAFWLSKYYSTFYLDLIGKKNERNSFIYEDNKISFWYFQIRVISNIQTFEYNCYRHKNIEINNKFINVRKELEVDNL